MEADLKRFECHTDNRKPGMCFHIPGFSEISVCSLPLAISCLAFISPGLRAFPLCLPAPLTLITIIGWRMIPYTA